MFLYELALDLDVRSTDLVDQARSLGMDVGPSTFLTPEQVQHLRSGVSPSVTAAPPLAAGDLLDHGRGAPPPPPPPPSASPSPGPSMPPPPGPPGGPARAATPSPAGPHAPAPNSGEKQLPPSMVALYFAVPVLLLLGIFAYVSSKDDGGSGSSDASSGPAGIFGPDDGATPVADPAEVADVEMFCGAWADLDGRPDSAAPSTFAERREVALELYPDLMLDLTFMGEAGTGFLRDTALDARDSLRDRVLLHKELPADEASLTADQQATLQRMEVLPTQHFEYLRVVAQERCD
jgi:hypothetical protein